MNSPAAFATSRAARRAFSLMELLTVVAIIGLVSAMVVPAVNGFGKSAALATSGNRVANLAMLARQTAISQNTMSALFVLGAQGTTQDYRALTVLAYDRSLGWTQVAPWELLPDGVIVDPNDPVNCTFLANSPQPFPFLTRTPVQKNPPILYQGAQVNNTAYAARIFLPSGALQNPEKPAQLRLVEGYLPAVGSTTVVYTHRGSDQKAVNYYDIAILGLTGTTKISRP